MFVHHLDTFRDARRAMYRKAEEAREPRRAAEATGARVKKDLSTERPGRARGETGINRYLQMLRALSTGRCARATATPRRPSGSGACRISNWRRSVPARVGSAWTRNRLLEKIRSVQHHLAALAAGETPHQPPAEGNLTAFLNGLATA